MTDTTTPQPGNPIAEDGLPMCCRDCLWYFGNVFEGICRGAPPSVAIIGMVQNLGSAPVPQTTSLWPRVAGDKFCGAFKAERDKALEPLPAAAIGETEGNA